MDLILNNTLEIQESGSVITNLDYADTDDTFLEQERNVQRIAGGAISDPLDFGHITAPKYIRLKATLPVTINLNGGTIFANTSFFELKGEVVSITVTNSSLLTESVLDFVVMQ